MFAALLLFAALAQVPPADDVTPPPPMVPMPLAPDAAPEAGAPPLPPPTPAPVVPTLPDPEEPAPPPAPAATPAVAVPVLVASRAPWYASLEVDGFVSVAYTANLTHFGYAEHTPLRVFDYEINNISVDLAELTTQYRALKPGDAGFKLRIGHGRAIPARLGGDDLALIEGTASYIAALGRGLRLDIGTFMGMLGSEVVETYDDFNANYSRSLLFGARPLSHTGAKLGYAFTDAFAATVMLADGVLANVPENNQAKHLGVQLRLTPCDLLELRVNWLGGAAGPGDSVDWSHTLNLVALYRPQAHLALSLDVLAGLPPQPTANTAWWGVAAAASYAPVPAFALGARAEYLRDVGRRSPELATLDIGADVVEVTLTPTWRPRDHFALRLEGRVDAAVDGSMPFPASSGTRAYQATLAANALAYF